MNVNYERYCRLCLSSRGELLPIFPTTSSDDTEPSVLASKIKDCVSVQINENDDLPTNICKKCVDNVNNWHIFKSVCERTQDKLLNHIKKDVSLLEQEVNIKNEPLSDEAYDDGVIIDASCLESENAGSVNKLQPEGPPILASLGLTPRSDKKYVDPRMDWHRVHAILDLVQDSEVIDSLQSTEECDVIQYSDHESDTDGNLQSDIEDQYVDCKNGYICRNNGVLLKNPKLTTILINTKIKEANKLRKRKANVIKNCPCPRNAWQLLFTDDLLDLIVTSTNHRMIENKNSISLITNVGEIKTVIGILYLHGVLRPTHPNCSDLWGINFGTPCIKRVMKYDRFIYLLQNLSFDNKDDDIIQFDIMKRIRKVFEIFAMNCRTAFEVENLAVIDEVMVPVYGPCPFRYEIDKKQIKRGIKIVLLVDSSNFYVNNLDVITDPYFGAEDIVKKLTLHLAGSGKTVIMDSWYYSSNLMKLLKNEYHLFTMAALKPNSDDIPPIFRSQYRKTKTFMSGFMDDDVSLTSFVSNDLKTSNVVTNDPKFYKKNHLNRTSVVSSYKKNQSTVEVIDVLMHYYTTMQNTNDWTLSLFFTLLNIAVVNAQVIWTAQNNDNGTHRRQFIKDLAVSLFDTEVNVQTSLESISDGQKIVLNDLTPYYKNRKRCRICAKSTKRDRRTKQYCAKCGQPICREHTINICTMCIL